MEFASLLVLRTHCKQRNSLVSKTISAIKKIQYCEVKMPEKKLPQPGKASLRDEQWGKQTQLREKMATGWSVLVCAKNKKAAWRD